MQDELEKTEGWIRSLNESSQFTHASFSEMASAVCTETERIKKIFVRSAFVLTKEKKVERFIQYHQAALVHLIDRVVAALPPSEMETITELTSEPDWINMLKLLYVQLEELLTYIEKHFTKYFSLASKTPESYRFMVHREIKLRLPDVRYGLEKKGINKRLLAIILSPLDTFVECITAEEVSYRRIIYLRQLLTELEDLAVGRLTQGRLDVKICLTLCYLNYNAQHFIKFCTNEINRRVQEQTTLSDQIERLSLMLKIVNQVQPKPGFVYDDSVASIREQLSVWIGEEIVFFEKRQRLAVRGPNPEDPVQKDFKLQLSLTVGQVACLLRALKELGVIRNNNMLEVIRVLAPMIQARNTENVSWESMRSKFYQVESFAREGVREFSANLSAVLNKL